MKKWVFICILIGLLSSLIRLYRLSIIPNGFFFDEATISYQAYSIIKTGNDTWGTFLPLLSFKDYGEYILPLGVYFQAAWVSFFGLTIFASRFPHTLLGIVTTLVVIWVGKNIFGRKTGALAGFLFSVSPLALGWNRFTYEGNLGTLTFLCGVGFMVKSLQKEKYIPLAAIFFGLTMLTYHIFLVTVPIFLTLILYLFRPRVSKSVLIKTVLISVFFSLWALGAIVSGSGRARFSQAASLITTEQINVLNHNQGYCQQSLPPALCRVVGNKYLLIAGNYFQNYVNHFSPQFLFFDGTFLRRNILPQTGLIYQIELFTLALGLIFLLKTKHLSSCKILLVWALVYPLSNSFTGIGEISRIAFAAPLFSLISARGIISLLKYSAPLGVSFLLVFIFEIVTFLVSYFQTFPITNAYYTDYGYDRVYSWINSHKSQYENIYITKNYSGSVPYISAMFFLPVDPRDFSRPGVIDRSMSEQGYYVINRIRNIHFFQNIKEIDPSAKDLIIVTPEEASQMTYRPWFAIIDPTGRNLLMGISPLI